MLVFGEYPNRAPIGKTAFTLQHSAKCHPFVTNDPHRSKITLTKLTWH